VSKGSDLDLVSNIELSEIDLKNQNLIKKYFPNTKEYFESERIIRLMLIIKTISYPSKVSGKVKLENEFNKIEYSFSKKNKKYNFETDLEVNDAPLQIDIINYEKNRKFNSQLRIIGDYTKKIGLNLKKVSLISKNNKLLINNLILDNKNKIVKVDKIDLDYFDNSEKRNEFVLNRIKDNYYELNGSLLNA
jgi:hypothetical protein